ncbi:MAG: hypothetical protein IPO70_11140 [Bacteroidetes bacterium]|nr:hypothetical protein [Bacteroidota bacterium]MBK9672781.1 hypothetical protein [Bacteroidota bacterium]MBP6412040.1 hypothetical protein [Bacteroidia bacterium]
MSKVNIDTNPFFQSGYAYLQAAGSDGTDNTVIGRHLRWDFLRTLGENHLAKGDNILNSIYSSNSKFDRSDDFIKISKTLFTQKKHFLTLDFSSSTIPNLEPNPLKREWKFTSSVDEISGMAWDVIIRFTDTALYDELMIVHDGISKADEFLGFYSGIIEVEPVDNKLSFYYEFGIDIDREDGSSTNGYLRVETVCMADTVEPDNLHVGFRKKFTYDSIIETPYILSENIKYIRFDFIKSRLNCLYIICYEHYIVGVNNANSDGNWQGVGSFALSTVDDVMQSQLLPYDIHGTWPKFNDVQDSSEVFRVNSANYWDRWRKSDKTFNSDDDRDNDPESLQNFVHTYLKISVDDNTRALVSIPEDNTNTNFQEISYLDMLRLISLDYHIARMIGLGFIDKTELTEEERTRFYIYCLEYRTDDGLDAAYQEPGARNHIFMTLPTNLLDSRLPKSPSLTLATFGVSVDNGTGTPTLLTDIDGYSPFGNNRFININRGPYIFEKPFGPFYYEPTEFELAKEAPAVAYGIEYKEENEEAYRIPEISHDPNYHDPSGVPETMLILETGKPTIYTHQEREEGNHKYSSYGINWFSRVSALSNEILVSTAFPKKHHLLPPFNLAVQLIQDEDPTETAIVNKVLVLTTAAEQTKLANISSGDNTLVRASFDWNYVHHNAHQSADYAELFFRTEEPSVVKGKIVSVILQAGNIAQITTSSYLQYSVNSNSPQYQVVPNVSNPQKFVGSLFSSDGNNYVIESVTASATNPVFYIKQIKEVQASAPVQANQGQYISAEKFIAPKAGDLFFALENMSALENWDLKHTRRVYLEKFFSNSKIGVRYSSTHIIYHDIKSLTPVGADTRIDLEKAISNFASIQHIEYAVRHKLTSVNTSKFIVAGDQTSDFIATKQFRVFGSKANDGVYTVLSSSILSGFTTITVLESIPNTSSPDGQYGLVEIIVSRGISGIGNDNKSITILGDKLAEINLAHIEQKLQNNGTYTRQVIGGINGEVSLNPIMSYKKVGEDPNTHEPILFAIGTGYIEVIFHHYVLEPHIDKEVSWNKGIVRLTTISGEIKPYQVVNIGNNDWQPTDALVLIIQDSDFVLDNGSGSSTYSLNLDIDNVANYHPSYKLYLRDNEGANPITGNPIVQAGTHFNRNSILPSGNSISRKTYMAVRSYDCKNDFKSFVSSPVVLLGQKITVPVQPNPPVGPFYATRPDFYGKSTYTFDTVFKNDNNRVPYGVLFYRSSEDRILDVLYRKSTQVLIWSQLNALTDPMAKYDPLLWEKLFKGDNNGAGFKTYNTTAGSFTWPLPDNDGCFGATNIPLENSMEPDRGGYIFPFEATNPPTAVYRPFQCNNAGVSNFDLSETEYIVYGRKMTGKEILKKAILSAFLPLTEQAPVFSYIKSGTQTSSEKSRLRDSSGSLIDPIQNDIYPMIKRLPVDPLDPKIKIRFTDYTLDGASKSVYFYLAMEMSAQLKYSEPSFPVGPIKMVNAYPADKPQIKKVISVLHNAITNTPSSVAFELNSYSDNEKISEIAIYRAYNEIDALSIRTMTKFDKIIPVGDPVIDDFSDLDFPPYGEKIYYRIVALRELDDVADATLLDPGMMLVKLPSKPSEVVITSVVDTINPEAPEISFTPALSNPPVTLIDVNLSWPSTCYNGKYYLYKMTNNGNWQKIYEVKSNAATISVDLIDTSLQIADLVKTEGGNTIYHRFRVQVENSSGLLNITQNEITI